MKANQKSIAHILLSVCIDAVIAVLATYAALLVRYAPERIESAILSDVNRTLPKIVICYTGVLALFRSYSFKPNVNFALPFLRNGMATIIAFGLTVVLDLFSLHESGTLTLYLVAVWAFYLCIGWAARLFMHLREKPVCLNPRRVMIVGNGDTALRLASDLSKSGSSDEKLIGIVCDDVLHDESVAHLGKVAEIPQLVKAHDISDIMVAFPPDVPCRDISSVCLNTGCSVKVYYR